MIHFPDFMPREGHAVFSTGIIKLPIMGDVQLTLKWTATCKKRRTCMPHEFSIQPPILNARSLVASSAGHSSNSQRLHRFGSGHGYGFASVSVYCSHPVAKFPRLATQRSEKSYRTLPWPVDLETLNGSSVEVESGPQTSYDPNKPENRFPSCVAPAPSRPSPMSKPPWR